MVYSFNRPSALELEHDYLWRHAQKLPEHGQIAIFNRSHYENVLISKVHPEIILTELNFCLILKASLKSTKIFGISAINKSITLKNALCKMVPIF